ncbi:MAG: DNA methyltransferase [Actinomycetota bacterium]
MIQTQLIYCGDNLQKLRELPDECVDLIYIDPPFNSNRNYEVFWGDTKEKRAFEDRFGAVEHYIHWMRPRVMELYRVLKKTGSLYYHCDWHADSYVRVMLDQVFGPNGFRRDIVWKRTSAHANVGKAFAAVHDAIFYYSRTAEFTWNPQFVPYDDQYLDTFFDQTDESGRRYARRDLTAAMQRASRGQLYEWKGLRPPPSRCWAMTIDKMDDLDAKGRIHWPKKVGGMPRLKLFPEDLPGVPLTDVWTDIPPLHNLSPERLGYPTQKPLTLLDRIIKASSNEGDVILDAFCGCGTALEAAQNLKRRWIGIDVSPTSCRVMAKRLIDRCLLKEGKDFWVRDLPKTAEELRKYPPFEFENWAVTALNTVLANGHAIANRAQVGDMGIDGKIYPASMVKEKKAGYDLFGESDRWFPVQVKQKDKASRPDIDSFETAMLREGREKGFFISFGFTSDATKEIKRAFREQNLEIIPITVQEILDEEVRFRV